MYTVPQNYVDSVNQVIGDRKLEMLQVKQDLVLDLEDQTTSPIKLSCNWC